MPRISDWEPSWERSSWVQIWNNTIDDKLNPCEEVTMQLDTLLKDKQTDETLRYQEEQMEEWVVWTLLMLYSLESSLR